MLPCLPLLVKILEVGVGDTKCLICWGSGKVRAFRGAKSKLRCIYCGGTGHVAKRVVIGPHGREIVRLEPDA